MMQNNLIGAVVIGRNEGQRLITCLESVLNKVEQIVYVDSGSSDNSLHEARSLGVDAIPLDMSVQFTAARARNVGAQYLIQHYPHIEFIQFIDGDCEVQEGWVQSAFNYLDNYANYAVVCGRVRERFPEQSIYNQLCDIEWDTVLGDSLACGGIAMIRTQAFNQVNGYSDDLIAGEEPEMCFRLRGKGWKIRRIEAEMVLHDAAMTTFSQWWSRTKRAGYANAEGFYLHGRTPERYRLKQILSNIIWGAVLPAAILLLTVLDYRFLFLLAMYPVQVLRLVIKNALAIGSYKNAFYYSLSNVLGKFPQLIGMARFVWNKLQGKRSTLIEHK